jgi:photosystem II stability/assembly factor-like uncharacterized protein
MKPNAWLSGCLFALLVGIPSTVVAEASDSQTAEESCNPAGLRGELDIRGRVNHISVAPSGTIWIVTQTGYSYYTDDVLADWRKGGLDLTNEDDFLSSQNIDRVSFFDDEMAIASGYISGEKDSVQDTIFRTEDGGRNWTPVRFPSDEWIYDVFVTKDGKAWMGGSSGSFLYSEDFGASWVLRSSPFKKKDLRTHTIFMKDSEFGILGSLHNTIKITPNNGESWHRVPTPVDQGVLETDEDERNPRIESLAIFKDTMIVEQGNRVFHSRMKPVEWTEFTEPPLIAFAVDPGASKFIGVASDLTLVEIDSELKSSFLTEQPLHAYPVDITYTGGDVFAIDVQNGIYQIDRDGVRFSHPLTTAGPREPISIVRHHHGVYWGSSSDHVYRSNDGGASWCRLAAIHVAVLGLEVQSDGQLLLWDGHGTNRQFNPETNEVLPFDPFGNDDIVDIVRRGDRWVAYGGMQYETRGRVEVSRTFFSGQFRGSVDHGFAYVSEDAGMTWNLADTWPDGGVAQVFVGDEDIWLLSYLGSVRKLTEGPDGWGGEDLILAVKDTWDDVPYVERPSCFYFPDEITGYIGGWIHRLGNHYFMTSDGGYNWQRIDEEDFPYRLLTPLDDCCLAIRGKDLVSIVGTEASVVDLTDEIGEGEVITDISVDGQKRILIELAQTDDEGWTTDERRWHLLGAADDSESQN